MSKTYKDRQKYNEKWYIQKELSLKDIRKAQRKHILATHKTVKSANVIEHKTTFANAIIIYRKGVKNGNKQ